MPTGTIKFYQPRDEGRGFGFIVDDACPDKRDRNQHVFFNERAVQGEFEPV